MVQLLDIKDSYVTKDLFLPILVWVLVIVAFLNVKNLPFEFNDNDFVVVRYFAKVVMTILFPLAVIHLFYKNKNHFGIYFPPLSESFKLSLRAYAVSGPAGITFLLIGLLGWTFADWWGSLTLSTAYLVALYFTPKVTKNLSTRDPITTPDQRIIIWVILSFCTVAFAYFTYEYIPAISKVLYYMFIVGLGEELLFRGYLQSSFNRFFGKSFSIGNVKFGWGLILSALLFGLMHALVVTPPLWPWALFTLVLGLILGFIREKDGSILSAVLLHAMLDMPLVFFSV
ncbi:MAG: CPBP family intramembrane glutamic endopeptidase [Balneolaceae bacterium]